MTTKTGKEKPRVDARPLNCRQKEGNERKVENWRRGGAGTRVGYTNEGGGRAPLGGIRRDKSENDPDGAVTLLKR